MSVSVKKAGHLYFHSPCFDGIVSAVLLSDYLESKEGWSVQLIPCDYSIRDRWLAPLKQPAAIVDFLYHPDSIVWFDHHVSAFLDEGLRQNFLLKKSDMRVYDERATSCSKLIWQHLKNKFHFRNPKYEELVVWADKIDSARYESVSEAVLYDAPALRISATLASADSDYCNFLVQSLKIASLTSVSSLECVKSKFDSIESLAQAGLKRLADTISLKDDVALFSIECDGVIVNRYAPYYYFPKARYSVGLLHFKNGTKKITMMRNPWLNFECFSLGNLCAAYGGGGHRRVGSILLNRNTLDLEAKALLDRLVEEINRQNKLLLEAASTS